MGQWTDGEHGLEKAKQFAFASKRQKILEQGTLLSNLTVQSPIAVVVNLQALYLTDKRFGLLLSSSCFPLFIYQNVRK